MPYLLNAVYGIGRGSSEALHGKKDTSKALGEVMFTFMDTMNPFGGTYSFANFVSPTILDPVVDLYGNMDFTGRPIMKPGNPYNQADKVASQRYWNNTSPFAISVADWMHKLTGGRGPYMPGVAEVSPDALEYLYQFATGGVGTFLQRSYEVVAPQEAGGKGILWGQGDEVSLNDIPIARRFMGNVTSREDLTFYLENRDKYARIRNTIKDVRQSGDLDSYRDLLGEYKQEFKIANQLHKIENKRRKFSRQINKIERNSRLSRQQKDERIKALKERQNDLVARGNALVRAQGE